MNMDSKQQILDELADIFNRWQVLLAGLSEEQIHSPLAPSIWTVKDVVAHLWSWQQGSIAGKSCPGGPTADYACLVDIIRTRPQ